MNRKITKQFLSVLLGFSLVLSSFIAYFVPEAHAEELTAAEDLFISEYIEGGSNNKAIEIYNGTGSSADLSAYSLELYTNGAAAASQELFLSGQLASGAVHVLAHPSADAAILALADTKNGAVINFNGDDAVVLKHNGNIIDVFGKIGEKSNWGTGDFSTKDHTLVRKNSVTSGDEVGNDDFDPAVEWESFPKDTFTQLGQHTMDGSGGGEDPVDPEPDPENPGESVSIAEARKAQTGQEVTVTGVVTADNTAIGGGRLSTYIQDETAGINVFTFETAGFPELKEGQEIKVTGKIDEYRQLLEIVPNADEIEIVSENNELPQALELSLQDLNNESVAESKEGQLIKVQGYVQEKPDAPAGGGYNVAIVDADFNGTTIRIMEGTDAISAVEEGKWYEFTGVLSQYNNYQVLPRKAADIQLLAEQPEPPSSVGEYESTVASVVDGDTIHLQTPVLRTTKVRYVNIDTPETYHTPKNEADESQKRHGEAAKAYLNELLKPGDKVIVKVGEEATDAYGRLLAQVIRQSDNLNTNLEMVKKGYASTYFIWPVGDETDYNMFQAAVKQAKDAGLGIWNPQDELAELPFVFRAREQGKGLLRYVGNSDTKEYVSPEKWAEVPVEKRIFFASPQEAEENGYSPAGGNPENNNVKVQLLSVNDLHGKIDVDAVVDGKTDGRTDYLAAYLREREATNPNTLTVHVGDMVGASSPVSALLQDEPTVEIMESIGFDVGTVGNHEFDEGVAEMLRMIDGGEHPNG
ncbi:thermonuclease family protein, partial [Bacillaceae bacterium Marseille-Q3522]|nr:thermonuclease family protein [Bacillaceae bacterium Marseille-Q3522]